MISVLLEYGPAVTKNDYLNNLAKEFERQTKCTLTEERYNKYSVSLKNGQVVFNYPLDDLIGASSEDGVHWSIPVPENNQVVNEAHESTDPITIMIIQFNSAIDDLTDLMIKAINESYSSEKKFWGYCKAGTPDFDYDKDIQKILSNNPNFNYDKNKTFALFYKAS